MESFDFQEAGHSLLVFRVERMIWKQARCVKDGGQVFPRMGDKFFGSPTKSPLIISKPNESVSLKKHGHAILKLNLEFAIQLVHGLLAEIQHGGAHRNQVVQQDFGRTSLHCYKVLPENSEGLEGWWSSEFSESLCFYVSVVSQVT